MGADRRARHRPAQSKTDPKINDPFKKPDVKAYIKKFESDERETYARRHEIVAALGLTPGMAVADVGAGTGLFTRLFAEKVGADGQGLRRRYRAGVPGPHRGRRQETRREADRDRAGEIRTRRNLPKDSVDLVFLSDVYHHLEQPQKILASIRQALKPGGKLVVVDFDRVKGRSTEFVLKHVRAGQDVFIKEIESAGFRRTTAAKPPASRRTSSRRSKKSSADRVGPDCERKAEPQAERTMAIDRIALDIAIRSVRSRRDLDQFRSASIAATDRLFGGWWRS